MPDVLKENSKPKKVAVDDCKEESLEVRVEHEPLKRLGGSIACFVNEIFHRIGRVVRPEILGDADNPVVP